MGTRTFPPLDRVPHNAIRAGSSRLDRVGGYFLSFEPPGSACPATHTGNVTAVCPRLSDTSPRVGQTLTTTTGTWTGTAEITYTYQWQRCESVDAAACANIADAQESSYVVPESALGKHVRVVVTATNPAPSFGLTRRTSAISGVTLGALGSIPGANQSSPPSISVLDPGQTTDPNVGDRMYAEYGIAPSASSDGWFNPKATTIGYRWLRCEDDGDDCNEIDGATSRTYTLQTADGTRELRVRVTGTNASGTTQLLSPSSYDVTSSPAAIADPLPPDEPGGPAKSQAPSLTGEAYVGETLAGSVGGWKDPTTDYLRRWVRCDADGNACTYIQKVATTDPEDGSTYAVRSEDLGSTLRMRVTADVNNDLAPDGLDNHTPTAVEVDTPPSAVVTTRGGAPAPPGPPGSAAPDLSAPVLARLSATRKQFVAGGKGTVFRFTTSEGGSVRVVISRAKQGRRVGARCRPTTRANRRRRQCTYRQTVATITRATVAGGNVAIPFKGKLGRRRLPPGVYRATVSVRDAAGNRSNRLTIAFRIVRR